MRALSVLGILVLLVSGCSGASTSIRFDGLRHPVSLSPVLYPEAQMVSTKSLGRFERVRRAYGTLYSLISFDPNTDLSEMLEEEIARLQGVGIINLRVVSSGCTSNWIMPLNLLPFWPSCVHLSVSGEVVGLDSAAESAPGGPR